MLAGCSLLPADKSRSEAVKSSEALAASHDVSFTRSLEVTPEMAIAISRDAAVTARDLPPLPPTIREVQSYKATASQTAGSHATASGTASTKLSLGAKLILTGVGIFILTAAILLAWRYLKGTAIGQAAALADDVLARRIRALRERSTLSTDAAEIARAQAEIAELEAERGRNKR